MIAVFLQDKQTGPCMGVHVCRDSQLLLVLPSITVLAFVLMKTLRKKRKEVKKYHNVLNIVLFFFFGRTFFEDLHLLRLTMTSIYICLVTCILPLFNCPVNHLVTVNIIHISFNSISYFTERNDEAR